MTRYFPVKLKPIQAVSLFTCPGSYYGLMKLNDKELLPWLYSADMVQWVPWFGVPLLITFLLSLMFGLSGMWEMYKEWREEASKIKNK